MIVLVLVISIGCSLCHFVVLRSCSSAGISLRGVAKDLLSFASVSADGINYNLGLGKSLSIISLLATDWSQRLQDSLGVGPTLLVVPPSLLRTWEEELKRHVCPQTLRYWIHHGPKRSNDIAIMLAYDLVITTYDVVTLEWRNLDSGLQPLYSYKWRRIVLDEGKPRLHTTGKQTYIAILAHEIRGGTTQRAKATYALSGNLRWIVTGTPIQNRWEDLASLLKFLKVYPDNDMRSLKAMLKGKEPDIYIKGMLSSICLRRPKNAIDLPRRSDRIHRVEFGVDEAAHYNSMNDFVTGFLRQGAEGQTRPGLYSNVLTKINSLRQICNLGTHYQSSQHAPSDLEAQMLIAQELFDGMLSAGVTSCFKCDKDLLQGDEGTRLPPGDTEGSESLRPQISTCGELICNSCFVHLTKESYSCYPQCKHQPSCIFTPVNVSGSSLQNVSVSSSQLPVKIRALQNDILALPLTEKR